MQLRGRGSDAGEFNDGRGDRAVAGKKKPHLPVAAAWTWHHRLVSASVALNTSVLYTG
jgi:hypothetical protein